MPPTFAEFATTVSDFVARYRGIVIDCSEVEWITGMGMPILEKASSDAPITLVNPNPTSISWPRHSVATFSVVTSGRRHRYLCPKFRLVVWCQSTRMGRSLREPRGIRDRGR